MRLFGIGRALIASEYTRRDGEILFSFYEQAGSKKIPIQVPLSDSDFRRLYKNTGFDRYVAYEELNETEFMENNGLPIEVFYSLVPNDDFMPILERMGLPVSEKQVNVTIRMTGTSGQNPEFELDLKNEQGIHLQHTGFVKYPFYQQEEESFYLPKAVWELYETINSSSFKTGYEKIAKVQTLARTHGFQMDDFLKRETYEYIDSISIEPKLVEPDQMVLEVKGASPAITDHLNGQGRKLPIGSEGKRTRFAESQQVKSDLKELRNRPVLYDEEIPQFFDNPKSLFPDHEFSFDIESFSERVKGFITIARPRSVFRNGKTEWFDSESGEPVPFDEEELKKEIQKDPKRSFYRLASTYIYAGNGLKADLGFGKEAKESESTRVTLDIYDNERALEYDVKVKGRGFESFPVPNTLQANLYDYQKEGFDWLCSLEKSGSAGLLADDMGLGKTMQVIAFLLHQREQNKLVPSLIVLPIALIENWKNEIEKFAPVLKDNIYIHQGSRRIKDVAFLENQPLTFISYDTLKADQLIFGQVTYQNIIADEAQNIKSHLSSRSRALRAMKGNFRLAMTGTPVENGLEELWTIMDFVAPGEMFSLTEFKAQFVKETNHELLMTKLKDFYLRRTKQEVLADKLPQKHLLAPVYLNASTKQKHLAGTVRSSMSGGRASALNALMHLRQLYAHPAVVTDEEPLVRDSPKLVELMALLGRVQKQQEKILVFTEFRKVHSILKTEITKKYGIHVPVIDGTTANRSEVVRQFNEKSGFAVMLLSPKAAGVGLTITSANHVVHFTRWWNPAVENQATDRAYRIGQTKDVYVYQLITRDSENFPKGTVEELMHELLSEKSALAENVIVPFDTASFQRQVLEKMKN